MIGVAVNAADLRTAQEFFELFKTPWEQAVPGRRYRVVMSAGCPIEALDADLFLLYGRRKVDADAVAGFATTEMHGTHITGWRMSAFPIYGGVVTFSGSDGILTLNGGERLDCRYRAGTRNVWRVGYDLFDEVRHLLTEGQPIAEAGTPTLELHIALLRCLLLDSGVSFVEVPPRPYDSAFICCLTHDIDFFGIRRHRFDRTLAGFAFRASVGTLLDLLRGRRSAADAGRNWAALLSLPLVFLGLAPDFWRPFDDYAQAEKGRPSTFFLVPFKGRPGVAPDGSVKAARAVPYGVDDIRAEATIAVRSGSELALHGIDAWRDPEAGRREMTEVTAVTGKPTAGVRMHWLYFSADSPKQLEAAGFDYDSTCGYNENIGYRAGTSQVFRLPASERLMELPLAIMDSALFFGGRMALRRDVAMERCRRIIANARTYGGTVVINWHDRSLAPERLWDTAYRELLDEIGDGSQVRFATAGEAVNWFQWRRSIRFAAEPTLTVMAPTDNGQRETAWPGVVRIHRPAVEGRHADVEDLRFSGHEALTVNL